MNIAAPQSRSATQSLLPFAARVFCVAVAFAVCAIPARADIQDPPGADYGPTRKLARGVSNIAFGWTEIPHNLNIGNDDYGNVGATYGLTKGVGRAFKRLGYGLFETVTFLFPTYKASYRTPYRLDPPWINGGLKEFAPEITFESKYDYTRYYSGY
jgi:putative exosortase-associated protein (TIGR04073 family)